MKGIETSSCLQIRPYFYPEMREGVWMRRTNPDVRFIQDIVSNMFGEIMGLGT